ncbi:hypothetical protein [Borrelia persica]|uniref:hypothetical protein n=1 Tax=Borrelia persica TaxID=44448 RepID=UPI000464A5F9|nr:hypothetical protein [Borrelia persica]
MVEKNHLIYQLIRYMRIIHFFQKKQTQIYSIRLYSVTKAKAIGEAKEFAKEKLEKDLKTLLITFT